MEGDREGRRGKDRMYEDGEKCKIYEGSGSERKKVAREGRGRRSEGREKSEKMQRRERKKEIKKMVREHRRIWLEGTQ